MSALARFDRAERKKPLTQAEIAVLHFRAKGLENKDVAVKLGMSVFVVKDCCQTILLKMHAWNMTEAVAKACKAGVI